MQNATQQQLRQMVEQIERLEEEKRGIGDDIKDKFLEAKVFGFDVKILRCVIRLRKSSKADRDEAQAVLDVYLNALGMLGDEDTPLANWADDSRRQQDAADNLARLSEQDGDQTTISINGGPAVPFDVARAAVDHIKRQPGQSPVQALGETIATEGYARG